MEHPEAEFIWKPGFLPKRSHGSWSSFKRAWTTRHKAADEDEVDVVEVQELDDPCRSLPCSGYSLIP